MNETNSWFFEKIKQKLINLEPWVRLSKSQLWWPGVQINKIKNEKEVATDREIQSIIRDYYEPDANKMDNLEEMDKFRETFSHPRLNKKRR